VIAATLKAVMLHRKRGQGDRRSIEMARNVKSAKVVERDAHHVPMRDFSQSLPMALLRAREAVMRQFRPNLRKHDITEQQWRILRALAAVETIEVTELARVACLLGPSLSRILRDLEARGLISRKLVARDQRRSVLSIAPRGLKLIAQVAPHSEGIYAEIARRYGANKLAELHKMLGELEVSLAGLGTDEE
jgi:homoprotocatechuate degradation regulator HpaR